MAKTKAYWKQIDSRMFDFSGFYKQVAAWLPDECRIVEVGVADGCSALFLADEIKKLDKDFTLYMIDSLDYGGANQLSEMIRHVTKSELAEHIEIMPLDSLNASCKFNDNSLHFAFIDASHKYSETKADIRLWWHKVKNGGILAGHDYHDECEVKDAVDELIPVEPVYFHEDDNRRVERLRGLQVVNTDKKFGVWLIQKDWRIKLNS